MAADTRALVRVLSELSWTLRREGFAIAPSQAVDIARAVVLLGCERKSDMRDAMAAIVGVRPRERALFDTTFDTLFDAGSRLGLDERLVRAGATPEEREMIRSFLDVLADSHDDAALVALLEGGGELSRLLSAKGTRELVATADSSLRSGVVIHRVIERLGYKRAYDELAELKARISGAFGEDRAALLDAVLREALARTQAELRAHVRSRAERAERRRVPTGLDDTPFEALDATEVDEVRRAVRRLVEHLRGRNEVRRRRARRGRIASGPTVRRAFRTLGVPVAPVFRARKLRKPRLVVLCDISESVRGRCNHPVVVVVMVVLDTGGVVAPVIAQQHIAAEQETTDTRFRVAGFVEQVVEHQAQRLWSIAPEFEHYFFRIPVFRLPKSAGFGVLKTAVEHFNGISGFRIPIVLEVQERFPLVRTRMMAAVVQPPFYNL